MITLENGRLLFEPGDTIANLKTWLQEIAGTKRQIYIEIRMTGIVRILKILKANGPEIKENGLDCDNMKIQGIKYDTDPEDIIATITVENDGSIQETLPIPVYYAIMSQNYNPHGYTEFAWCGKAFFDKHGKFNTDLARKPNLDDDPAAYNYALEIQDALLFKLNGSLHMDKVWATTNMTKLLRKMKKLGFNFQRLRTLELD